MSQSFGSRKGTTQFATIDSVNDAVVLDSQGADGVAFWVESVSGVSGLTLVVEVRYGPADVWHTVHFLATNTTNKSTPIVVTAAISSLPGFAWAANISASSQVRVRASGISGGSAVVGAKLTDRPIQ